MNYSECILAIVNFYHFEHIGVNQYMFLANLKEQETVKLIKNTYQNIGLLNNKHQRLFETSANNHGSVCETIALSIYEIIHTEGHRNTKTTTKEDYISRMVR